MSNSRAIVLWKYFKCEEDLFASGRHSRFRILCIRGSNGVQDLVGANDATFIHLPCERQMRGGCSVRLLQMDNRRVASKLPQPGLQVCVFGFGKEVSTPVHLRLNLPDISVLVFRRSANSATKQRVCRIRSQPLSP